MPSNNQVIFKYGTKSQYLAMPQEQIYSNALYFLVDTGELYRGSVPICQNHLYQVIRQETESIIEAQERAVNNNIPVQNDIMILTDGSLNIIYIYANEWIRLTPQTIAAESVVFENGTTLEAAIQNAITSVDSRVLEYNNDNELTIKDFQKSYYKYVPGLEGVGTVGDADYVPPTVAHYELQQVDENNPWTAGLELRTTASGIGWYQPNLTTTSDLTPLVSELQLNLNAVVDRVDILENTIDSLSTVFRFKGKLIRSEGDTIELLLASVVDPVIGDVWQIDDKEFAYNSENEWVELGSNFNTDAFITGIQINDTILTGVNGIIDLPVFNGSTAGLLPSFIELLPDDSPNNYVLNGAGNWVIMEDSRVGDLENHTTVVSYVNAKISENALTWGEIIQE